MYKTHTIMTNTIIFKCEKDEANLVDFNEKCCYKYNSKHELACLLTKAQQDDVSNNMGLVGLRKKNENTYLFFDIDNVDNSRYKTSFKNIQKQIHNVITETFSFGLIAKKYITKNKTKEKYHIHYPHIIVNHKTQGDVYQTINDRLGFEGVDTKLHQNKTCIRFDGFSFYKMNGEIKEKYIPYNFKEFNHKFYFLTIPTKYRDTTEINDGVQLSSHKVNSKSNAYKPFEEIFDRCVIDLNEPSISYDKIKPKFDIKKFYKINCEIDEDLTKKAMNEKIMKKRLSYFEEHHCKILKPFGYYRNETFFNHTNFIQFNSNLMEGKFVKYWLKQPAIKTFNSVDFLPPPLDVNNKIYNTFTGLRVDKIKYDGDDDFEIITNHIKLMAGNENKGYEYLLNYLAHMVQKPGELPKVAIVIKGEQGTGKSLFWNLFGEKVLGSEYVLETAEIDKVIGRFNLISEKFLIIMNETSGEQ